MQHNSHRQRGIKRLCSNRNVNRKYLMFRCDETLLRMRRQTTSSDTSMTQWPNVRSIHLTILNWLLYSIYEREKRVNGQANLVIKDWLRNSSTTLFCCFDAVSIAVMYNNLLIFNWEGSILFRIAKFYDAHVKSAKKQSLYNCCN